MHRSFKMLKFKFASSAFGDKLIVCSSFPIPWKAN